MSQHNALSWATKMSYAAELAEALAEQEEEEEEPKPVVRSRFFTTQNERWESLNERFAPKAPLKQQTTILTFREMVETRIFHPPLYQRPYSWTMTQWSYLMEDIEECILNCSERTMGSIVISPKAGAPIQYDHMRKKIQHYDIIDGQQRITTIIILLATLCPYISEGQEVLRQYLINTFLFTPISEQAAPQNHMVLHYGTNDKFRQWLRDFSSHQSPDAVTMDREELITAERSLLDAFCYFRSKARQAATAATNIETFGYLENVVGVVLNELNFSVRVFYGNFLECCVQFEALNTRDCQLLYIHKFWQLISQVICFGNKRMKEIGRGTFRDGGTQHLVQEAFDCVTKMEEARSFMEKLFMRFGMGRPEDYDRFLLAFWQSMSLSRIKNMDESYNAMARELKSVVRKDPIGGLQHLSHLLGYVKAAVRAFCRFCKPHRCEDNIDPKLVVIIKNIKRIGVRHDAFLPLLFGVNYAVWDMRGGYGGIRGNHIMKTLLNIYERFALRSATTTDGKRRQETKLMTLSARKIFQYTMRDGVQEKHVSFNRNINIRRLFEDFINIGLDICPDICFMRFLMQEQFSFTNWKPIRYLLYKYELSLNPDFALEYSSLTLEHTLPRNREGDIYWIRRFTVKEHAECLHRLGNLVLSTKSSNPSYGDRSFDKKCHNPPHDYRSSKLKSERQIADYSEWNPENISVRQKRMTRRIFEDYSYEYICREMIATCEVTVDEVRAYTTMSLLRPRKSYKRPRNAIDLSSFAYHPPKRARTEPKVYYNT